MQNLSEFLSADSASADESCLAGASAALDRFTEAFNACDLEAMDRVLHFPHTMLSGDKVLVWNTPGQHPSTFFESLKATGWRATRYESKTAVLASSDKVHFKVVYTRRDGQGNILSTHRNLWAVVKAQGQWRIALRSY